MGELRTADSKSAVPNFEFELSVLSRFSLHCSGQLATRLAPKSNSSAVAHLRRVQMDFGGAFLLVPLPDSYGRIVQIEGTLV